MHAMHGKAVVKLRRAGVGDEHRASDRRPPTTTPPPPTPAHQPYPPEEEDLLLLEVVLDFVGGQQDVHHRVHVLLEGNLGLVLQPRGGGRSSTPNPTRAQPHEAQGAATQSPRLPTCTHGHILAPRDSHLMGQVKEDAALGTTLRTKKEQQARLKTQHNKQQQYGPRVTCWTPKHRAPRGCPCSCAAECTQGCTSPGTFPQCC
jgi:hypothetical protein